MGNFSRDSFRETNILNNLLELSDVPVTDAKHYVGVRLQQGVPVLDADWNEAEDIRRMELLALIRYYIGNGVPAGNRGFQITTASENNNFGIREGVIMVDGLMQINQKSTTYQTQPDGGGISVLTTPANDRTDIVYIDVWEEEVSGNNGGDSRLIDNRIGIETAVRVRRVWVVRVEANANDLSSIIREDGHHYIPLARLNRRQNVAQITFDMIVDLRKTGITLSEYIKVPIFLQMGLETLDISRFTQMLNGFRTSIFSRLRGGHLPYQTASTQDENILLIAFQEVLGHAQIGEVQATSRNMDNKDGLLFMGKFYESQKEFMDILTSIGNEGNTAQDFISAYTNHLEGSAADFIKGIKPALDNQDLFGAVIAQERLNIFLSSPVTNLPEGTVNVYLDNVNPYQPLSAGINYVFSFDIESLVTSPLGSEEFNINAEISADSWTIVLSHNQVLLPNLVGREIITVTVTPDGSEPQAALNVTVVAVRNSLIRSPQPSIPLEIGVKPPVGSFFFYAGQALNAQNRLEIRQNHLSRSSGREVKFVIRNDNISEIRSYRIEHYIIPDVIDTSGWSPLESTPGTMVVQVNPNTTRDRFAKIDGPKTPADPAAIGTIGVIVANAKLIEIDGTPVPDGASVEVRIEFEVVN